MAVHLTVNAAWFDALAKRINGLKEPLMIEWVKFVGTHAQYDRIDVESVNDY